MVKFLVVLSAFFSLVHFFRPISFPRVEKVLGIDQLSAAINKQTIEEAVWIYCFDKGRPPENLEKLKSEEILLRAEKMDLDKYYSYSVVEKTGCSFTLVRQADL